ncbi:disease resistance protein RUN1-like [Fagus crenata]
MSLSRRFHSLDELPICLQAMAANNATSLEWILTGSNLKLSEQLILSTGCSKLLKKNHTSNPRKKLLKEHLWLHSVLLHHVAHLLEAGDEVEYSIHVSGSLQLKKFGVNLIYENDEKDYQSYFESMIQNASLPYKNDFLHEDVSTDQAMAGDQKIHPPYVQDQPSEGNGQRGWPYLHENPQGAMLFEGRAPFEQNMYSSGIPTINSMSQTERLRNLESEQMLWEAERQLLLHQLENGQRTHWAACEDAARASQQLRVQNAALERENIRLRLALARASQFAPHFESECASSAPTQSTIAAVTPMASTRRNTLGLDYATYPESPVLSIQSFNDPSRSSPPSRGSDLPQ